MDMNTLISIGVAVVVGAIVYYVFPKLKNQNLPVGQYLEQSKQFLDIIDGLTKVGLGGQNKMVVESIIHFAKLAVTYAEQLYNTQNIKAEERKDKAIEFIVAAMKEAGTELNDDQIKIANAVIESMVFNLPKSKKVEVK